ncbi:substrate-binding domain-containing protein [Methylocapsa sp. S129]|uniref:substrate-binding domain-containing protein n=1 Tax=Methylocapsa sp. S129 TaxID=1641869 RepID=UPI001FF059A6|nr:sugar ABC transporter substrate-binding protein [Methylocapsa sp. S129]
MAIVAGGPHPYFASWPQAGKDAARDFHLGAADYKVPQSWSLSQQNDLIESLASQGYNAFLVFPGDPAGSRNVVGELVDQGMPVIALAGCLQDPSKAAFCFATDTEHSAYLGAKELIKAMGGKGRIAHFTGFLTDPGTALRINGVKQAVAETNGSVELVQTIADIDAPEPAQDKINAFLATQGKQVEGIIATAWIPATVAATALRKIGDKRIHMIGLNDDPIILEGIKDGYVTGTMLQNPYGQAYIGSYALGKLMSGCKVKTDAPWLKTPQTTHFVDSGTAYVGASDLANYQDKMQGVTKDILASFQQKYLDCP